MEVPRRSCLSRCPTPTVIPPVCVSPPPPAQVHIHKHKHILSSPNQNHHVTLGQLSYDVSDGKCSLTVWFSVGRGPTPQRFPETQSLEPNSAVVYHLSFSWPFPSAEDIIGCCIQSPSDMHGASHWGVLCTSQQWPSCMCQCVYWVLHISMYVFLYSHDFSFL